MKPIGKDQQPSLKPSALTRPELKELHPRGPEAHSRRSGEESLHLNPSMTQSFAKSHKHLVGFRI